jgi:putative pyruvate formate lyase activating enzyme
MNVGDTGLPSYLKLYRNGELRQRVFEAQKILLSCSLCPRSCRARRLDGEEGECGGGGWAKVASFNPHFGEEIPLVGCRGSGTIFFAHCPLHCSFCQNWDISQAGSGNEVRPEALADMMINLQSFGCHNINLVTPTHFVPQILEALLTACEAGLRVPLVYNSGGYEALQTLRLLDGVIDIYMPDFKYADEANAKRYSDADDYPEVAKMALKEMHRQVGDLVIDSQGIAKRGLLVRHLVLPHDLAGTSAVLEFIAREISGNTYINIMVQYRPAYKAGRFEELNRRITSKEFAQAIAAAKALGLERLDGSEGAL